MRPTSEHSPLAQYLRVVEGTATKQETREVEKHLARPESTLSVIQKTIGTSGTVFDLLKPTDDDAEA